MTRHSKNNTALGFFTYAERHMLDYGTKKQRLTTAAKRRFDACYLCQQTARDPQCCSQGHLACKECFYEHILTQKTDIARQQKRFQAQQNRLAEEKTAQKHAAESELVAKFEKTETGLLSSSSAHQQSAAETTLPSSSDNASPKLLTQSANAHTGASDNDSKPNDFKSRFQAAKKRSHADSEQRVQNLADSKSSSSKAVLPSFWLPSLAPEAGDTVPAPESQQPMCTASDPHHPVSLKKLYSVHFTQAQASPSQQSKTVSEWMCPSCLKHLSNGTKLTLARRCGHVLCQQCMDQFVKDAGVCNVCSAKCKSSDIIPLQYEGTGFAGSGTAVEAHRYDVAFR
ncbi:hypothetical protein H4R34_002252 [Dimargaris verticillata]|uniref:RING-type domain-containing protein n=1 Tax=Dimargaris verticillata TaxID=2761393 RepID=A0A9W8ED22_9FUNG|nr:hypothetical protein H4R34_002252 [Dimargaris verticillata]